MDNQRSKPDVAHGLIHLSLCSIPAGIHFWQVPPFAVPHFLLEAYPSLWHLLWSWNLSPCNAHFLNSGFCLGLIQHSLHNDSLPHFMQPCNQMESIFQTFSLTWNWKNRHLHPYPSPTHQWPRALTTFPMFSQSATLADIFGTNPNKQNPSRGSKSGQQMGPDSVPNENHLGHFLASVFS